MSVSDILPPSPPNTSHRDKPSLPSYINPATTTPDESPASLLPSSSTTQRRRVEFSPWTNVLDAPPSDRSSDASVLKVLPRSKDCQTAAKSILKYQNDLQGDIGLEEAIEPKSRITMDSLVQALEHNHKITSLDAYQSLSQLFKTYDEVPDDSDTRSNIISIVRAIKRDVNVSEQGLTIPIDINLVTQALKVTVVLVWSELFSAYLPDDFRIFITDRAINVLAEHSAPKVIIVHYMHMLAVQNFRAALFTSGNRTLKLLDALREVTNHVQGKGAIAERLLIYQKLIEQARPIMKAKAGLWIKEVLLGLLSNVKDIRDKAISVGNRACAAFPASNAVSQAAREALEEETKERALSTTLTQRLERMIIGKDEAVQVPQIWALVMLFCNSPDSRLEEWSHIRDWLRVIQRCFNCSDMQVQIQAFPAWNRFIYITKPHEANDSMMAMLAKPISSKIERSNVNNSTKGARSAAVSSYITLLYYAFRPAASHKQYTRAWNEYIVKIFTSQFLSRSTANADLCCRILMALFWKDNSVSRIWNENRANENKLIEPEELPSIDCKWVRAKTSAIVEIFQLLFKYSVWGPSVQHSDQAFVAKSWRYFLKSIRESFSKEIKPSTETKKAMSAIVTLINRMYLATEITDKEPNASTARAMLTCQIAMAELGPLTMLEALETSEIQEQPSIIITEVLEYALKSSDTHMVDSLPSNQKQAGKILEKGLPFALQRSLGLLSDHLERGYRDERFDIECFINLLELTTRTLRRTNRPSALQVLRYLEPGLSLILQDVKNVCGSSAAGSRLIAVFNSLSIATIEKLADIELSQFDKLDLLLAAVLSSSSTFVVSELLAAWNKTLWNEQVGSYGPAMLAATRELQRNTNVNLPGLLVVSDSSRRNSQLEQMVQITEAPTPLAIDHVQLGKEAVVVEQLVEPSGSRIQADQVDSGGNGHVENLLSKSKRGTIAKQTPNHNDSQVQFVPVESSPMNIDDLESQMLTSRQKETRDRQRSEPAVTFADLRSSPQGKSTRSSRATSVDCEMARKIAASDNLPSTPTITRQATAIDDTELPSPTPKARHHILHLAEVDIPSSPPSVAGQVSATAGPVGLPASPSKVAHLDDIGMINLEDDHDIQMGNGKENEKKGSLQVAPEAVGAFAHVAEELPQQSEHKKGTGNNSLKQRNPDHAEPRRTSGIDRSNRRLSRRRQQSYADSSELDDPSASQLSQDLDWHLAEGANEPTVHEFSHGKTSPSRKRKRSIVNYADISGYQRRKRTSTSKKASGSQVSEAMTDSSRQDERQLMNQVASSPIRKHARQVPEGRSPHSLSSPMNHRRSQGKPSPANCEVTRIVSAGSEPATRASSTSKIERGEQEQTQYHISTEPQLTISNINIPERLNVISALEAALQGLQNSEQASEIDLKTIDDLCFKIRFQAQEIVRDRAQKKS